MYAVQDICISTRPYSLQRFQELDFYFAESFEEVEIEMRL